MDLALDHGVIEHVAGIVDRAIGDEISVTGLWIDLDLGDVAAVGKGLRGVDRQLGVEVFRNLAPLFHLVCAFCQCE